MVFCLFIVWICVIIVCKMLYQFKVVNFQEYFSNCIEFFFNSINLLIMEINQFLLYWGFVDFVNWFGVWKGFFNLGYIQNYLQVLLLLVFEVIVYWCQEYYCWQYQLVLLFVQVVFVSGICQQLDQDLFGCFKYFINFFFYKFGLEICFLMVVNVIGQCMNFMVILYGCWLVVIFICRYCQVIVCFWFNYCFFLVLFLLYQYLLCLGMFLVLCIDYLWCWSWVVFMNFVFIKWLYLFDFFWVFNFINFISDFFLLLCVFQQW